MLRLTRLQSSWIHLTFISTIRIKHSYFQEFRLSNKTNCRQFCSHKTQQQDSAFHWSSNKHWSEELIIMCFMRCRYTTTIPCLCPTQSPHSHPLPSAPQWSPSGDIWRCEHGYRRCSCHHSLILLYLNVWQPLLHNCSCTSDSHLVHSACWAMMKSSSIHLS